MRVFLVVIVLAVLCITTVEGFLPTLWPPQTTTEKPTTAAPTRRTVTTTEAPTKFTLLPPLTTKKPPKTTAASITDVPTTTEPPTTSETVEPTIIMTSTITQEEGTETASTLLTLSTSFATETSALTIVEDTSAETVPSSGVPTPEETLLNPAATDSSLPWFEQFRNSSASILHFPFQLSLFIAFVSIIFITLAF